MSQQQEVHEDSPAEKREPNELVMRTSIVARIQSYRQVLVKRAQRLLSPAMQRRLGASDAVQEAVVHVARQRSQLPDNRSQPANAEEISLREQLHRALRRVVRNAVRFHRRKRRTLERDVAIEGLSGDLRGQASASGIARVDRRDLLERALSQMNESQRELIRLRGEEELEFAEIAHQLGLPMETVKKRFHRAVKELRGRCEELGIYYDEP